jgi:hypothetical protein
MQLGGAYNPGRMTEEQVEQFLRDNEYPEHVVRAGIQGLVEVWRSFVEEVERGYVLSLFDYRHDLDARGILEQAGFQSEELAELDKRLRPLLAHRQVRVWESAPDDPWWDFGYPANAKSDFEDDLRSEGLI